MMVEAITRVFPLLVYVQNALDEDPGIMIPDNEQIQLWANRAVTHAGVRGKDSMQMTVRIVNEKEITQLNSEYRQKNNATNVLSFPFISPPGMPEDVSVNSLGDLAICASVISREAKEQHKTGVAHWAHMIIHGTLHLLGYDHQNDQEAKDMEVLEIAILAELGFDNPYE